MTEKKVYRLLKFKKAYLMMLFCLLIHNGFSQTNSKSNELWIYQNQEDSLTERLTKNWNNSLESGDTLSAIKSLNQLASIYCNRVNYSKSYDGYWKALLLADQSDDAASKAISYNGLAILYSLYERREEALKYYLLALDINRDLVNRGTLDQAALNENYFPLAVHYKYEHNPELAHKYLDSCELLLPTDVVGLFTAVERAHLFVQEKKFNRADKIFNQIEKQITENSPDFTPILYSYIGDLHAGRQAHEQATAYYIKSIAAAKKHLTHLNFVPDVYEKLSAIMSLRGNPKQANEYLKLANQINEYLYSSRSPNNQYLLEIKDEYRLEKERNERVTQERRLRTLEQEQQISNLKIFLLVVSIGLLFSVGFFLFKYWRTKHKTEKRTIELERQKEAEKSREILSVKNKELTLSTLQLIAKDELLSNLKNGLKQIQKETDSKVAGKLMKEIGLNKDQSWLEFEKRFSAVNNDFYKKVKNQFPDLTPYDLKICALLKLDFTGKEMATLLGISAESAQTSRYRLRKKLGLKKEDNLVDFMNEI
ncbi:tetratricopeptide repeat protein [Reichenbachiella carrageenanivorans]|uniref:Tetratricopeptide repeat protein n=1 Tax=Reichenbachiella carrageenanivorans TaxID=2979869 RepID=A0ABY6CVD8_9BACT|nr:tetratricopeptide repeat protein [Reichenbachiella carrageenanivorans]UXX77877.1 tetratricopeptide repeat protein [Reichenbachiella carrageenanivorans]